MKSKVNPLLFSILIGSSMLMATPSVAQTKCCDKTQNEVNCVTNGSKEGKAKAECSTASLTGNTATSGCLPSACRGAKTKYGEAQVITNLREDLVALKAAMEKSKNPSFDAKFYKIKGLVGHTDDESLDLLIKEFLKMEKAIAQKTSFSTTEFKLPENKAKRVQYLSQRIEVLRAHL